MAEEEAAQAAQAAAAAAAATTAGSETHEEPASEDPAMDASFMSESIYQKLPSPRSLKHRSIRMTALPH